VADKTTPEYYVANIALKNDSESACFSDPGTDGKITMVDCTKGAKYNYVIDVRGYIKFINTKTGLCIQPETYANGAHLIEKPCTQLDYQWWSPVTVPGGWRIQNAQTNTCTRAPGLGEVAVTETCRDWAQSVIAPVTDPYSGITYTSAPSGAVNAKIPSVNSDTGICNVLISSAGNTRITGTTANDNKCLYNYNRQNLSQPTGGNTLLVTGLDGTLWQAQRAVDKIPEYAIPGGFIDKGANSKATYICRAKRAPIGQNWTTKFGWVAELNAKENYCNYPAEPGSSDESGYERASWDYEVLVRRADRAYLLNLSDWKPGGAKAGKDPIATALAKQHGLYRGEKSAQDGLSNPNGTPMRTWKGQVTVSTLGDIVSLKGRLQQTGRGNPQDGPIWKLPAHLAPPAKIMFFVTTPDPTDRTVVEVLPDGTLYARPGNSISEPGSVRASWIDLSNITYSTAWAKLPTEGNWNKTFGGYAGPVMARVGKRVVLSGLALGGGNRGGTITHLPKGSRPPKKLTFNVVAKYGGSGGFGGTENDFQNSTLDIFPDGRIVPNNKFAFSFTFFNLSGIAFDAGIPVKPEVFPVEMLNGWQPDLGRYGEGGTGYTISDDIITLKGGVTGNKGIYRLWQLPEEARPEENTVFNAVNSEGVPMRITIKTDGWVSGARFKDENMDWVSLDGLTYNRKSGNPLSVNSGWRANRVNLSKQGNTVVLGGVVTPESPEPLLLTLPEGARPRNDVSFTVSTRITERLSDSAKVLVRSNGQVEIVDNKGSYYFSVSLSGITFSTE